MTFNICPLCQSKLPDKGVSYYTCYDNNHVYIYTGGNKCWYFKDCRKNIRVGKDLYNYYIVFDKVSFGKNNMITLQPFNVQDSMEIIDKFYVRYQKLKAFT